MPYEVKEGELSLHLYYLDAFFMIVDPMEAAL